MSSSLCKCCLTESLSNRKYYNCNNCKFLICKKCLEYGQRLGIFSQECVHSYFCSYKCFEKNIITTNDKQRNKIRTLAGLLQEKNEYFALKFVKYVQFHEFYRIHCSNVNKILKEINFIKDIRYVIILYVGEN